MLLIWYPVLSCTVLCVRETRTLPFLRFCRSSQGAGSTWRTPPPSLPMFTMFETSLWLLYWAVTIATCTLSFGTHAIPTSFLLSGGFRRQDLRLVRKGTSAPPLVLCVGGSRDGGRVRSYCSEWRTLVPRRGGGVT